MEAPLTPLPWAGSDMRPELVFHDNVGVVDVNQPVAQFRFEQDAAFALAAIEILTAVVKEIKALKAAFGAPGDYGYSTPQGQALFALYQTAGKVRPALATREVAS